MKGRWQVQTIIDADGLSLWYHPAGKIVHHQFRRFVHGDEFRDVLLKGLEIVEHHGATKWLSDDRGNGPLKPADSDWATKEWTPRVMEAGWKYWAVVLPAKTLGQMNMRRWIEGYEQLGLTVRTFGDPDEALAWLKSVD